MPLALLALTLLQAQPMPMTGPAAPCPAAPPTLAPELAGWTSPTPLPAASTAQELGLATLPIGHAATATLKAADRVAFARPPEHAPAAGTSAGLFAFTVTEAGRYRIALGAGAWVDLVRDGQALPSAGHGHGPDCTGIRKMVDFALQPGKYVLQVSGNPAPTIQLMVAKLPA
jgi:hypothetical protein